MKQILQNTIAILNRAERKRALLLVGLNLVVSVLDIGFLACLLFIVQLYSSSSFLKASFVAGWITDRTSLWPVIFFFVLFAIKNMVSFLVFKAQSRFRYAVSLRISFDNLWRYFSGSFGNYVHVDSAVHFGQINLQPAEFSEHVMEGLQEILQEWTLIILTTTAILLFNAKLFLLLMVLLFPPVVIAAWITRRQIVSARANIANNRRLTWQRLEESITAFVEANLYGKKRWFATRYYRSQQAQNKHLSALQSMQGIPTRLTEVFAVFGLLSLIVIDQVAGHGQGTGFVTLGAFLAAAYKIIPGIARILNLNGQMRAYAYTLEDLVKNLSKRSEFEELPAPKKLTAITLQDISFRYDQRYILQDLHLQIQAGCFLGIEGHSGRGKTTVLHLLLGFLTPEKGAVLFNGENMNMEERRGYWRRIAYIKQQPLILHDSLLTNITLDEETVDEERLTRILSVSGLDAVVDKLPGGVESVIAEGGKNISGGQRQRIAIARALYKEADMYILDEPFSELDEASEERLLEHFKQLSREGKMVILITHNKKSLSWCNQLLSLDEEPLEKTSARNRTYF